MPPTPAWNPLLLRLTSTMHKSFKSLIYHILQKQVIQNFKKAEILLNK